MINGQFCSWAPRSVRLSLTGQPYLDAAQGWIASGHESMCSFRELRRMDAWQSGQVVLRLGQSSLTCSCMRKEGGLDTLQSGKMETGIDTYIKILLHHVLPAPIASVETMHAPAIGAQILLPSLLVA